MSLYYTHTLIPDRVDYVPDPTQVFVFFQLLSELGAAPVEPELSVMKPDGVRTATNPKTGEVISIPRRASTKIPDITAIPQAIEGLDDYDTRMSGQGAPDFPLLKFDHEGSYYLEVRCCVRPTVVSTSDWHNWLRKYPSLQVPAFGQPCSTENRTGVYSNPGVMDNRDLEELIEVPNAGCARFWIGFMFGKFLFPKIDKDFDLLPAAVVEMAQRAFDVSLVQACFWG